MNDFINPTMDQAASDVESLIENLSCLENTGWLGSDDMNEISYYLSRIVNIVGLPVNLEKMNDEYGHIND